MLFFVAHPPTHSDYHNQTQSVIGVAMHRFLMFVVHDTSIDDDLRGFYELPFDEALHIIFQTRG